MWYMKDGFFRLRQRLSRSVIPDNGSGFQQGLDWIGIGSDEARIFRNGLLIEKKEEVD
jgi:hypothetical protein